MENQDKIFDQFKDAAQKAEAKDFPGMDKIWSRVDEKLDKKILSKKSNLWKKIAVAASIVAIISIGYQFLKPENEIIPPTELPQNNIVIQEDVIKEDSIIVNENPSKIIKSNAEEILQTQIVTQEAIATYYPETEKSADIVIEENDSDETKPNNSNYTLRGRVFDAIGVHHTTQEPVKTDSDNTKTQEITKKAPPLVILDGKKTDEKTIAEMDRDDLESVVYLKEPLYIINGVEYSEKQLFGPNPTSPYYPIDKQDIKTVTILQDEEAVEKYGRKGEKGVVIITTKTGKPAVQK